MFEEWIKYYHEVERKYQDPRTEGWFMVGSPVEGIVICLAYVILVTIIGPRFMKNREPYNIRGIMVTYNFSMVLLSAYMLYLFLVGGWATSYSFGCVPMDPSTSPEAMAMVMACYLFYLSKFIELLDTVFFVLRKKFQLITFLHVFHHAIMPASWWLGAKFSPGGMGTFHAMLNTFVHVCMYVYYGIAAMGPEYQKYIWWKKYMTKIQIIQFITVMIHTSQLFITQCDVPKLFAYLILAYAIIFLVLFLNFYVQAYRKRKQRHSEVSNGSTSANGNKTSANGNKTSANGNRTSANGNHSKKPQTNGNNNYNGGLKQE